MQTLVVGTAGSSDTSRWHAAWSAKHQRLYWWCMEDGQCVRTWRGPTEGRAPGVHIPDQCSACNPAQVADPPSTVTASATPRNALSRHAPAPPCPCHGAHEALLPFPRDSVPHWNEHSIKNAHKDNGMCAGTSWTLMASLNALCARGMSNQLYNLCQRLASNPPNGVPIWRPLGPLAIIEHRGRHQWNSYLHLVCYQCSCMTPMLWPWGNDEVWSIMEDFLAPYHRDSSPRYLPPPPPPHVTVPPRQAPEMPRLCTVMESMRRLEDGRKEMMERQRELAATSAASSSTVSPSSGSSSSSTTSASASSDAGEAESPDGWLKVD